MPLLKLCDGLFGIVWDKETPLNKNVKIKIGVICPFRGVGLLQLGLNCRFGLLHILILVLALFEIVVGLFSIASDK